jgi:hypothetical protein
MHQQRTQDSVPATITTGIDKLVHQNERRADSLANLVRALEVDGSAPRFPEVAAAKAALDSNETDEIAAELKLSIEEATQDGFSRSTLTSSKWMDSQICKTSGRGWATTRARLLLGYNSMTTALTMVSIFFPDVRFSRSEPGQPMTTLEWCLAARTYAKTGWRQRELGQLLGAQTTVSRRIRQWMKRWGQAERIMLNKFITRDLLLAHQPAELAGRFVVVRELSNPEMSCCCLTRCRAAASASAAASQRSAATDTVAAA